MKSLKLSIASLLLVIGAKAQVNWKIDNSHTKMGFSVTHMTVTETEGKFKTYEGSISSKSETDFTDANVEISLDVASINTDDEKRDGHLKSGDFFDAEKYPKITFKSTSIKKGKAKNSYIITGDLTMKGITKKVTFNGVHIGKSIKSPWGTTNTGFAVTGVVNRQEFGVSWNKSLDAGGVVVGDLVKISCQIELIKL